MTFVQVNHVLTDRTVWEARVSGSPQISEGVPNLGYDKRWTQDLATGIACCGTFGFYGADTRRLEIAPKLTHYASGFLGGDHDFKFGAQIALAQHKAFYGYPGGGFDFTYLGEPYLAYFREPYTYRATLNRYGAFAKTRSGWGWVNVMLGVPSDRDRISCLRSRSGRQPRQGDGADEQIKEDGGDLAIVFMV